MTQDGGRGPARRSGDGRMVVLGESRPAVEDTTPELLQRRQEELERARRELARERRAMARESSPHGGRDLPPEAVWKRRNMGRVARVSTGVAALLIAAGTVLLPQTTQAEEVESFISLDTDRAAWQRAALAMDEETADLLGGPGLLPTSVSDLRSGKITDGIRSGDRDGVDSMSSYHHDLVAEMVTALEQRPVDPQHVRETWDDSRDRVSSAVSRSAVQEAGDALATPHPVTPYLLWWATTLLGMAALGTLATGQRLVAGLSALAMVPTVLLGLAAGTPSGPVTEAVDVHQEELARIDEFSGAMSLDQRLLLGVQEASRSSSGWEYSEIADRTALRPHEQELLDTWQEARSAAAGLDLATATPEEVHDVLAPIVSAGQEVVRDRELTVRTAREAVVEATDGPAGRGTDIVTGVVALALALAAAAAVGGLSRPGSRDGDPGRTSPMSTSEEGTA